MRAVDGVAARAKGNHRAAQNDEREPSEREAYIAALKAHDWSFEMSEDPLVYQKGRISLAHIASLQRVIDPFWTLWNQHAPADYRVGALA